MKKAVLFIFIGLLMPQIAFAAWWNPFTWFKPSSRETDPKIELLEAKILELEKKISENSTTTSITSTTTASTTDVIKNTLPATNISTSTLKSSVKSGVQTAAPKKVVPEKDYDQIYKALRVSYTSLRQLIVDEVYVYRNKTFNWQAESEYWGILMGLEKAVNDDITYLASIEKTLPKPQAIIDSYLAKQENLKIRFSNSNEEFKINLEKEKQNRKLNELRISLIDYIKANKDKLYIDSYHISLALMLDNYDRTFGTDYYKSFNEAKTKAETIEFANHFLMDLDAI